jgi:hypothetical protein
MVAFAPVLSLASFAAVAHQAATFALPQRLIVSFAVIAFRFVILLLP